MFMNVTELELKSLMLYYYRRIEELKENNSLPSHADIESSANAAKILEVLMEMQARYYK